MLLNKKRKTVADALKALWTKSSTEAARNEGLEEMLLASDVGALATLEIMDEFQARLKAIRGKPSGSDEAFFLSQFAEVLKNKIQTVELRPQPGVLNLFLMLGVNGVGKTTSIAKLAHYYREQGWVQSMVLAAADTFRAAAIDQLQLHGERLQLPVVAHQPGGDPSAVIYDAVQSALAKGAELVIADTAGRMHTKVHLMEELKKMTRIAEKQAVSPVIKKILVLDATTGQNGIHQAELFHEAVGVDAILLSKYDSLSKGGIALTIARRLGIPFAFVGVGEGMGDLRPFRVDSFVERILSEPS